MLSMGLLPYIWLPKIDLKYHLPFYKKASDIEERYPAEAMETYKKLESKNKKFYKKILLLGICYPSNAYALAYFIVQHTEIHSALLTVLIWCVMGFGPPLYISTAIESKKLGFDKELGGPSLYFSALGAFIIAFSGILEIGFYVVIAIILSGIISTILNLTSALIFPVFSVCFVTVFLFFVSDVPMYRVYSIRWILTGVKLKAEKILLCFFSLSFVFILGGGSFGVLYENYMYGIIISAWTGAMVGLALSKIEEDPVKLGDLYRIAKVRCLIRLDRHIEAHYLLTEIEENPSFHPESLLGCITGSLRVIIENYRKFYEVYIDCLNSSGALDDEYVEMWSDTILKTQTLLNEWEGGRLKIKQLDAKKEIVMTITFLGIVFLVSLWFNNLFL
jgi:hypothetical protein